LTSGVLKESHRLLGLLVHEGLPFGGDLADHRNRIFRQPCRHRELAKIRIACRFWILHERLQDEGGLLVALLGNLVAVASDRTAREGE
jgi:hypothetical protein